MTLTNLGWAPALFVSLVGQVVGVRVGVHSTCPEGVPGCWAFIYEGLERVPNLKVEESCDFQTWMVRGTTGKGMLPDPNLISRRVKAVGAFFSVRGVELVVRGTLQSTAGSLFLKLPSTSTAIRLKPARQSIEWDPETKHLRTLSLSSLSAFEDMHRSLSNLKGSTIEVTGTIAKSDSGYELAVLAYGPVKAR